jgi:hypothetical protein
MSDVKTIEIKEFRFEDMPLSCTWLIISPPGSGKTSFVENVCYYTKHLYPVGRCFMGTETGYERFSGIFHPLYVSNGYEEADEIKMIRRQRLCALENGQKHPSNYSITVIDDPQDKKILRTNVTKGLFKLGSQHWHELVLIGMQHLHDPAPDVRDCVSYVAFGRNPDVSQRKKMYEMAGGICGHFDVFNDLMDQLTGDFSFLIIKKRTQSNDIEDCVFYYQVKDPAPTFGNWKFGCKEYRTWAENRYNKSYVEDVPDIPL